LSALQVRGRRIANVTQSACGADPIAGVLAAVAPGCVEACPGLCASAPGAMAAMAQGEESAKMELCASSEALACALNEANAERCAPAIAEAEGALGGKLPVSKNAGDFKAMCSGSDMKAALLQRARAGAADVAAARQRAVDRVLSGKEADKRCEHASEGQTCVSKNSWIYCSAHKRLSGPVDCERRAGHMSLCRRDGIGLAHDYCDDPFCRNGGAYGGSGHYCHKGNIVLCRGSDPPRLTESCSDRTWKDSNGDQHTDRYVCAGYFPDPYCRYDGSSFLEQQHEW